MCTLSWLTDSEGYSLWFNRDELHTRAPELAPQAFDSAGGVGWLAPLDPESGGTWLMTNQCGVTVALLNDYASIWSVPAGRQRESRGRLVPMTADAQTAREAVAEVLRVSLDCTPPFNLVAVDGSGGVSHLYWNGSKTCESFDECVRPPMTSSSFQSDHVEGLRKRSFPRSADRRSISAYHHAHDATAPAESVNMSCDDAATRSISSIRVGPEWVVLDYEPQNWPGAPRVNGGARQWRLPRHFCLVRKQD